MIWELFWYDDEYGHVLTWSIEENNNDRSSQSKFRTCTGWSSLYRRNSSQWSKTSRFCSSEMWSLRYDYSRSVWSTSALQWLSSGVSSLDLSRNHLSEFPRIFCSFFSLDRLNLYQNAIKIIPEQIVQIRMLKVLNLSRNQLAFIPPSLCKLPNLEILILNNNKLLSLPEEIGQLERLIELVNFLPLRSLHIFVFIRMLVPMISHICHIKSVRYNLFERWIFVEIWSWNCLQVNSSTMKCSSRSNSVSLVQWTKHFRYCLEISPRHAFGFFSFSHARWLMWWTTSLWFRNRLFEINSVRLFIQSSYASPIKSSWNG